MGKGALRFPGQTGWDMGFFKNFPVHERMRLQFRAEFFNLFNRVNYTAPNQTNQTNTVAQRGIRKHPGGQRSAHRAIGVEAHFLKRSDARQGVGLSE